MWSRLRWNNLENIIRDMKFEPLNIPVARLRKLYVNSDY